MNDANRESYVIRSNVSQSVHVGFFRIIVNRSPADVLTPEPASCAVMLTANIRLWSALTSLLSTGTPNSPDKIVRHILSDVPSVGVVWSA